MKAYICYLMLVISIGCAKAEKNTQSEGRSAPAQPETPKVTTKSLCGDTIVETMGYVLKVDPATTDVWMLDDGVYGFETIQNGWGGVIRQGCHYTVQNGTADLE